MLFGGKEFNYIFKHNLRRRQLTIKVYNKQPHLQKIMISVTVINPITEDGLGWQYLLGNNLTLQQFSNIIHSFFNNFFKKAIPQLTKYKTDQQKVPPYLFEVDLTLHWQML